MYSVHIGQVVLDDAAMPELVRRWGGEVESDNLSSTLQSRNFESYLKQGQHKKKTLEKFLERSVVNKNKKV